jgi:PadR family transcriptional regulator, regulatory protein PadR
MGRKDPSPGLLPGTLDLLILRSLAGGPMHVYGISGRFREVSDRVLRGASEDNRRATFNSLTTVGRRQLARERHAIERTAGAIFKVPETA